MGDSASGGCGSREQTLLEAAKAMLDLSLPLGEYRWDNLRAAIAREEAKPTTASTLAEWSAIQQAWAANERAQQAEASAAWWKAEGERLSAELALAKNQMTLVIERSEWLSGQLRGCEYDLGQTGKLRNRAEKAETELAKLRAHVAKSLSMPAESTTDDLIDKDLVVLTSVIDDLARTGVPLPLKVRDAMPLVVDELLRLRAELEERRENGVVTAQDVCDLRARAMRAEAEAASVRLEFDAFASKVLDQDLKAAMGDPKVGIVRDPVTGWTFDTMRQQFDAARTTVRVLAAELVAARQQIAGTKGFEA